MKKHVLVLAMAAVLVAACGKKEEAAPAPAPAPVATAPAPAPAPAGPVLDDEKVLNIYNWPDYITETMIADFEKEYGIKVNYDTFENNEALHAKLVAGNSGYDIVVPTAGFGKKQIDGGLYQEIDKGKIPNYANLDPALMKRLENQDPGNQYAVPYMWGTTGIGYNVDKVKAAFGNTDIAGSLDIVFKPENIGKLKDCGVTFLDTPSEIIPIALNYLGEDPNSQDPAVIDKAAALLKTIRPYITNFHSSQYIDAMANGDTCLVVGWSGDIIQARDRAVDAGNGVNIAYAIPKEGAPQWFDMLAIPKDAKHLDEAYAFINNLLDPQVMANNSNFISYPNAIPKAKELMDKSITDDPTIYPTPEVEAKLFTFAIIPPEVDRQYTRIWTELKTGK